MRARIDLRRRLHIALECWIKIMEFEGVLQSAKVSWRSFRWVELVKDIT
jgi:hypothetical protein